MRFSRRPFGLTLRNQPAYNALRDRAASDVLRYRHRPLRS